MTTGFSGVCRCVCSARFWRTLPLWRTLGAHSRLCVIRLGGAGACCSSLFCSAAQLRAAGFSGARREAARTGSEAFPVSRSRRCMSSPAVLRRQEKRVAGSSLSEGRSSSLLSWPPSARGLGAQQRSVVVGQLGGRGAAVPQRNTHFPVEFLSPRCRMVRGAYSRGGGGSGRYASSSSNNAASRGSKFRGVEGGVESLRKSCCPRNAASARV